MKILPPPGAARALVAVAALLIVPGCATKGDLRNVRNEILSLSARQDSILTELRFQSSVTQDTLASTARDLFNIRGELISRLTSIQGDLDRLGETVGLMQNSIASMRDQNVSRGGVSPAVGAPGPTDGGRDADLLYDAAVDQYNRNALGTARTAFRDFLDQYPNDELAPRAMYYLAEILEQENDPRGAIAQFLQIGERFPLSETRPDGMYRAARLHVELGETNEARDLLRRVINTYPDNPITPLARQELADLGGGL